jgi:hypothetical protein
MEMSPKLGVLEEENLVALARVLMTWNTPRLLRKHSHEVKMELSSLRVMLNNRSIIGLHTGE